MINKIGTLLCIVVVGLCLIGCLDATEAKNVNEIIKLLKADVGEDVIKAHITKQDMTFNLSTNDILNLKKAGASNDLLSFMFGSNIAEFPFEIENEFIVKKPTVYKHLAVYPVFRKKSIDVIDFITLDQAQQAKVIIITERPDATVPTVIIKNKGKKPIYIMAGEIIIGGKQDRMVSFDILIPAGKEVAVEVRCVEHGRWSGKSAEFKSGGAVASKKVRTAIQFEDQQDVWNNVAEMCQKHGTESSSGTYGAILSSAEIEQKSKPFFAAMKQGLADEKMVGMIMALNGEVLCVDIFSNPKFFKEVKEKLLKAYILDAISVDEKSAKAPGKEEILSFFDEMKNARTQDLKKYDENSNVGLESEIMIGNESRDKDGRLQHLNLNKK